MKEIINYYNELATTYDAKRFRNTYGTFIDEQERKLIKLKRHQHFKLRYNSCKSFFVV